MTATTAQQGLQFDATGRPLHSQAFRFRRALNWFPLGLTYAFLYMGRYNLTVAKNALGHLMTKEDFGVISGVASWVYALAFLINGPLTDRLGGKRAILTAAGGSSVMNLLMGLYVQSMMAPGAPTSNIRVVMAVLYGTNMFFQSAAAVAVIKVNAHWFHVRERGGFSGIFGTMISSGLFFAYTLNGWILDYAARDVPAGQKGPVWWVFMAPSAILAFMFLFELVMLRDTPGQSGHSDFDTGDAGGPDNGKPAAIKDVILAVLRNPVIMTIAAIELCTGVLRNGVMQWFPVYAKEVWVLPSAHPLMNSEAHWPSLLAGLAAVVVGLSMASAGGRSRAVGLTLAFAGLVPFVPAGWGGFLFAAGVLGSNTAGWVSDLLFQSRRAPAAGGLYALLTLCVVGMVFTMGGTTQQVAWVKDAKGPLQPGDIIESVSGTAVKDWAEVQKAWQCVPGACPAGHRWDVQGCNCAVSEGTSPDAAAAPGTLTLGIRRAGEPQTLTLPDPLKATGPKDRRTLAAGPDLTLNPWWLGIMVFLLSVSVIGTHGLLSGAASVDFGGRKAAATAVGIIDGFVYLGNGIQSLALGFLTSRDWAFWPLFLLPFGVLGFALCRRIWDVKPGRSAH